AAHRWLEKEPPCSITTWEDLVSKFINEFFPPSRTTSLHNEISNFEQKFIESFHEAWDRYKDLLRACPHHGFTELHQLNTFYNALNPTDQDSLNAAAGGNLQFQANPPSAQVKAVKETYVTCGGAHPYYQCLAAGGNTFPEFRDNIQEYASAASANYNQGYPGYRPQGVANQMRPPAQHNKNFHLSELERIKKMNDVSMKAMQNQIDMVKNELRNEMKTSIQTSLSNQTNEIRNIMASLLQMNIASPSSSGTLPSNTVANPKSDLKAITTRSGVSYDGPLKSPPVAVSSKPPVSTSEPANTPVSASKPNHQASIPYPSRRNDERNREKAKDQIEKFYQIFKDMSFEISFTDALILISRMAECLALADLGASINLMPYSVWKKLSLLDLTPTYFDADPRVPLILGRSFLKTEKALIDVFEGELTLRVGKAAITFNLDQTSRYSANYNDMTAKRIDVIDMACEEYSQEVLGFSDTTSSGNPTPLSDPIVFATSLTLTPFGGSDFLLEEVNAFLAVEDESISSLPQSYLDPEGDILLLEALLNDDPSSPLQNQRNSLPKVSKELKICEAKTEKSLVDEPPMVELKALFSIEYERMERPQDKRQKNKRKHALAYERAYVSESVFTFVFLSFVLWTFHPFIFKTKNGAFTGSGPFTIAKVFPYGTVELSQANGPNFKVNGHRVKHYFGGDVPQLDCSDCEVFHALSIVLYLQELHILNFILGI
nr:hypothetical protein [Tanacetum cinerariifolium]